MTLQPFAMRFPRADIHELLTPDHLHQVIKGTFKDHLVQWVEDYLIATQGAPKTKVIPDEIDQQCVELLNSFEHVSYPTFTALL